MSRRTDVQSLEKNSYKMDSRTIISNITNSVIPEVNSIGFDLGGASLIYEKMRLLSNPTEKIHSFEENTENFHVARNNAPDNTTLHHGLWELCSLYLIKQGIIPHWAWADGMSVPNKDGIRFYSNQIKSLFSLGTKLYAVTFTLRDRNRTTENVMKNICSVSPKKKTRHKKSIREFNSSEEQKKYNIIPVLAKVMADICGFIPHTIITYSGGAHNNTPMVNLVFVNNPSYAYSNGSHRFYPNLFPAGFKTTSFIDIKNNSNYLLPINSFHATLLSPSTPQPQPKGNTMKNKTRGLVKNSPTAKLAGQKAKVSKHYNALIANASTPRQAAAYKAHKTMKLAAIENA
jgi:hypothetical protein